MSVSFFFSRLFFCLLLFASSVAEAQWVQMKGPEGCVTLQLAEINGAYWVCTFNGIFTSTDKGLIWKQHPVFNNFQVSHCVAQYGDTIYVCAQEFTGYGHWTRLYTSLDKGANWTSVELNPNLNYPTVSPGIPQRIFRIDDVLFIVAQNHLLRSFDFGANWEVAFYSDVARYAWDEQRLLCTTQFGVYQSDDAGLNWDFLFGNNFSAFGEPQVQGNRMFVPRSDSTFVSNDVGQNWTAKSAASLPFFVQLANFWKGDAAILYAAYDRNLYKSPDFGHTWVPLNSAPVPVLAQLTEPILAGNTILAGTQIGLFRSDDNGAHWNSSDQGIFAAYVGGIQDNGQQLFINSSNELFRVEGAVQNWKNLFRCEIQSSNCFLGVGLNQNEVYFIADGRVYYSPDLGDHFNPIADALLNPALPAVKGRLIGQTYYYLDASRVLTFENGVFKDSLSFGPEAGSGALDFFEMDGRYLLAPLSGVVPGQVFYSDDKGASWQASGAVSVSSTSTFYRIDDRLFISGEQLYYSDDRGEHWVMASVESPAPGEDRLIDFCKFGNRLFAGREAVLQERLFYSDDMGATWKIFSSPFDPVQRITAVHVFGNALYAGVLSSGVWHTDLSVDAPALPSPAAVETLTVWPNPVGNMATIQWKKPLSGPGILEVRATDGRLLLQLTTEPGATRMELPVSAIPPGIYLLRLQSDHIRLNGRLLRQ